MTTAEEGMEYVDVNTRWKDEALHFTPWLADNLDMLSAALGVKLELVQTEAPVGPFFCDILAREVDSGVNVAIENQLYWTDHSHLSLLTYAAGLDARIAVWVAPEFRYEHAETLHWLNQWTRDGLKFYGVKVMLLNTGNAPPEPRLLPVVTPDGWNKDITQPRGATMSPRIRQFHDFFRPLIAALFGAGFAADRAIQRFSSTDRHVPSRLNSGIWYAVSLEGNNDAWVTLHIQTDDKDLTKRVFDQLMRDKANIEASIATDSDQEWRWHRHNAFTFSSINIRRNGSIDDPPEKLEETRTWMLDLLPRLKEVFDPRVEHILKELQGKELMRDAPLRDVHPG